MWLDACWVPFWKVVRLIDKRCALIRLESIPVCVYILPGLLEESADHDKITWIKALWVEIGRGKLRGHKAPTCTPTCKNLWPATGVGVLTGWGMGSWGSGGLWNLHEFICGFSFNCVFQLLSRHNNNAMILQCQAPYHINSVGASFLRAQPSGWNIRWKGGI